MSDSTLKAHESGCQNEPNPHDFEDDSIGNTHEPIDFIDGSPAKDEKSDKDDSVGSTHEPFDCIDGGCAKDRQSDKDDSVGSTHKPSDFIDGSPAKDEQSDEGTFQILLGVITYLLKISSLLDSKKRGSVADKRITSGIKLRLNNCTFILVLRLFAVAIPSVQAAHQETPLTLRAGSNGVIPFNCSVSTPLEMSNVFYTVRFEARDRPFCVDGVFDQEGFISPDQSERFSIKLNINIDTLAININIVPVSTEDEGTYELQTIYAFGSREFESDFMTKIVKVHVPPSPAMCYFTHNADYTDSRLLRCYYRPENGKSTLTCLQNGEKIPHRQGRKEVVTSRIFWVMNETSPVVCCSHELGEEVNSYSCGQQFRYPRSHVEATTVVYPKTQSKGGSVVMVVEPTEAALPKVTERSVVRGSGSVLGNIPFSTIIPLMVVLLCR